MNQSSSDGSRLNVAKRVAEAILISMGIDDHVGKVFISSI